MAREKEITIKVTLNQLSRIADGIDTLSGLRGCFDQEFNAEADRAVKAFDAILKKNGLTDRKFK